MLNKIITFFGLVLILASLFTFHEDYFISSQFLKAGVALVTYNPKQQSDDD
ncbi:hypothetical protein [Dolichospermum circinale]|uniref:hypothetical protein n=1 Tax=Dolichospermum circinale TaxID=109265 RepID=UPI00232D3310|nr:hypothetical protein [Dolichospermum circinale]MDB9465626.1 hypothetical protein [Dolichospermum circinale CS-539/09]MDB9472516.1 hypothetical protein [Dolichospermum circinale CS-539]